MAALLITSAQSPNQNQRKKLQVEASGSVLSILVTLGNRENMFTRQP